MALVGSCFLSKSKLFTTPALQKLHHDVLPLYSGPLHTLAPHPRTPTLHSFVPPPQTHPSAPPPWQHPSTGLRLTPELSPSGHISHYTEITCLSLHIFLPPAPICFIISVRSLQILVWGCPSISRGKKLQEVPWEAANGAILNWTLDSFVITLNRLSLGL